MKPTRTVAIALALYLGLAGQCAIAVPLDFEAFTDSFPLTNEITGLAFSGATVLTAGVGLNEIDYPPSSGINAVAALLGSLTISADDPFNQFSAYFTFDEQLTFSGFDVVGSLLLSFDSPTSSNLGSNSLIGFAAPGISSLVITTQGGTPFTLDDLNITVSASVPEPGTLALLPLGALAAAVMRRRRIG